ncbi:DUF488 family protein [Erwinia sp. CPCC 100877]|nr:DUF488 family protein [Erwinia sp. CPCC 100877]
MIQLKRAYLPADSKDGYRVLVDRLWPRGVSKEKEDLDLWLKEIAPSNELRQWFHHESAKFPEFKERYAAELQQATGKAAFVQLVELIKKHPTVTLVYGAKNEAENNAVVLKELLEKNVSETKE